MKLTKSLLFKFLIIFIGCFSFINFSCAAPYSETAINYNNLGIAATKKGNYEQAIIYFNKAIDADSSLANAYYNLGSVYSHLGHKDKAIKAFNLLLRTKPEDDEAAYLLANLYFEKHDYEKALVYLNSIEKNSPSYKDSLELFKKINKKINESVIQETVKPVEAVKPIEPVKSVEPIKPVEPVKPVASVAPPVNVAKYTFSGFSGPTGIAENSRGELYVANYSTNSISVLSPNGKLKTIITSPLIDGPVGIAIDSKDNIYVANYSLNNVIKIDKNEVVRVISKDVVKPYYLYLNKSGALYVSEQNKNTVIRIGIPE